MNHGRGAPEIPWHVARLIQNREMTRLFPGIRWQTPLELLAAFMLLPKPDAVLTLLVDIPHNWARAWWPNTVPPLPATGVTPTVTLKLPVIRPSRATP